VAPLPGVWPRARAQTTARLDSPLPLNKSDYVHNQPNDTNQGAKQLAANEEDKSDESAQFPLHLLRKLGAGVERATIAVEAPARSGRWPALAVLLAGSTISAIRLLLAIRAVVRLRNASRLISDETICRAVDELRRRCGCRRAIEVRESDQLTTAAACGWSRPVILLPIDWRQWSQQELQAVLAHEVAHVRRADYIQRLVALAGAAVYFYHPLVRALAGRLAIDQELAADRLARSLGPSERAYTQGLARLALRYHDSLQDRRSWSNVSIMPRSSDFLARRLEMLRDKNDGPAVRRMARLIPHAAVACLVAIAFGTALLRGAATADEKADQPASSAKKPVEKTALLPNAGAASAEAKPEGKPAGELFRREAFDPSMIRPGSHGAFLIRVGELMRHPEVQSHADSVNKYITETVHELVSGFNGAVDLSEIEWIAGDLILTVKGPERKGDTNSRVMMGSGGMVIRTSQPGVSADVMIKAVPEAKIKQFEGKSYVEFPVMPAIGRMPVRMRFPDDKTIIVALATNEDVRPADADAKLLKRFLDDTPKQHEWAKDWQAVDGGLVTVLIDNSKAGWLELPKDNPEYPQTLAPLFEKTRYVGLGLDWTERGNRTGLHVRATCADQATVKEVHLAAMTAIAYWPSLLLDGGEAVAKYHKRMLQLFATLKVQPSADGVGAHFVEATADVSWEPQEFVEVLRALVN
jgi:beta-lactamase regulating signal transducer with metallopeptidase domain